MTIIEFLTLWLFLYSGIGSLVAAYNFNRNAEAPSSLVVFSLAVSSGSFLAIAILFVKWVVKGG